MFWKQLILGATLIAIFFIALFIFINAFLARGCQVYCSKNRGTSLWRYDFIDCECGEFTKEGVILWVSVWKNFP